MAENLKPLASGDLCIYPMQEKDMPELAGSLKTAVGKEMYGEFDKHAFRALIPNSASPEVIAIVIGDLSGEYEIQNVPKHFDDVEHFVLHVVATTVINRNQVQSELQ